ncbi:adenosylcobinamide-GDP ribazoletransferase [Cyanobacterium stanieri LEGE 03274]|uniref:Adenosylcobinamide-GDP ribazoletransferase n=1 Tax=Cyanobacterium stanieri LEGE 03274 TaxID=1828756 RepID=A0ABR9V1R6_9CHRO|nr:adenosylcobinamide-GDP ribazoletransferase [Cyanobacterium stanieri]MBE9221835.1 adenosylcobinamide-GDP ribazoletransferase [Cyanobacterium stanieri LEGE 03274]
MKIILNSCLSAIAFYTIIPMPRGLILNFQKIPLWLGWIGLLIGGCLIVVDVCLSSLSMPLLTKAGFLVGIWVYITGGLHLDGVMDTADGLATQNPDKRLEVMADSVTGAYGVMASFFVLGLKVFALVEITSMAYLAILLATSWGRWAQLSAIALYPYLKENGKGKFLKQSLYLPQDWLVGSLFIIALILLQSIIYHQPWQTIVFLNLLCLTIALAVGGWFNWQLKGHTGDTYGATVEWTEVIILTCLTIFFA